MIPILSGGGMTVMDAARRYRERIAEANRRERELQTTLANEMENEMADIRNLNQTQDSAVAQTPSDYVRARNEQDLKVFEESKINLQANIADFQKQLANTEAAIAATKSSLATLEGKLGTTGPSK